MASAKLPQPLFELAVAVLQFLVLAGELAQLVLQPLDAHFRIRIIRLRESREKKESSAAIAATPMILRGMDDILP